MMCRESYICSRTAFERLPKTKGIVCFSPTCSTKSITRDIYVSRDDRVVILGHFCLNTMDLTESTIVRRSFQTLYGELSFFYGMERQSAFT